MEKDRRARLGSQASLRGLRRAHAREVDIFCSHDVLEFERLAGHPPQVPAAASQPQPQMVTP